MDTKRSKQSSRDLVLLVPRAKKMEVHGISQYWSGLVVELSTISGICAEKSSLAVRFNNV